MQKPLIPGEAGSIQWKSSLYVDLASPNKRTHILTGDATGGGHMWPGKPGKSVFPESWDGDKIMHEVSDVLTDPDVKWIQQTGPDGADFTRAGDPTRWTATAIRDGVEIKVVVEPAGKGIITAIPLNGPGVIRNPSK